MMGTFKWRTILGLILVYVAVLFNLTWVWGILFLMWVLPDILSGITYFMEPVDRQSNPLLYWVIIISWVWMAVYLIAASFFPQLNYDAQSTQSIGVYEDQSSSFTNYVSDAASAVLPSKATTSNSGANKVTTTTASSSTYTDDNTTITDQATPSNTITDTKETSTTSTPTQNPLTYKTYNQKETHHFIGIAAEMNMNDPDLAKHTADLWQYFYDNDISQAISNIVDDRIYFLYSPADQEGNYKATIGFRAKNLKKIYEGLEGVSVSAGPFAVFEQTGGDAEQFIAKTWEKIYNSDLALSEGYNMEVYKLDKNYEIQKTEIRVSLK